MRKTITREKLRRIIAESVSEALKYDKERKQYFPDYTGNRHSDAGKYTGNYKDDFNHARNYYKWHDQENQRRFNWLQAQSDLEANPDNPDRKNEYGAEEYLEQHSNDNLTQEAIEEMMPEFNALLQRFCDDAKKRYPILKSRYNMLDLKFALRDAVDDF